MGRWKPALPFGGSTVIETVVHAAKSVCGNIVLVGGKGYPELRSLFSDDRAVVVLRNPGPEKGMLSSVQIGVSQIVSPVFFIVLGDMPLVKTSTYRILLDTGKARTSTMSFNAPPVLAPRCDKKEGHPVLLRREHAPSVLKADPLKETLHDVLRAFPKMYVDVRDEGVITDLDTPEDYRRICGTDLP